MGNGALLGMYYDFLNLPLSSRTENLLDMLKKCDTETIDKSKLNKSIPETFKKTIKCFPFRGIDLETVKNKFISIVF
jgi:hypothetical protein